ncbi:MAG TPA: DUF6067 family protein, partial [Planctomycetota bacterium]|nr:DUF6067 family protein [Planctomycetota bacterium]
GLWPPVGVLDARLTVSPPGAATAGLHQARPNGIRLWNVAPYETLTAFDYGAPTEPLRPIAVFAARNGVFSGRLAAGSAQPIKGLKVTVGDLAQAAGGAKIPSSAVLVRCAEPAVAGKSWLRAYRFDGLFEAIPAEIPVSNAGRAFAQEGMPMVYHRGEAPKELVPGAVASLWFTVRVPRDAKPGRYEGTVSVAAEGLAPTSVPLRVDVSDWTVPDPKDFRVANFLQSAPDSLALHYGVPRWSDKHFELIGRSMALAAEVNSRQAIAELCLDFFELGGNAETMVRWIRQPDGSYKHDFTVFDKFLDTVAKNIGKPHPLRLACWREWRLLPGESKWRWLPPSGGSSVGVTLLDPSTGTLGRVEQPPADSPEFIAFWKPVLDEVRKKLEARGWFDDTTMQGNSYASGVSGQLVDALHKIWPDGVWSYTAHNGLLGGKFTGTDKKVAMPVRYADTVWNCGRSYPRGYRELLKPRPGFFNFTYRESIRDEAVLTDVRRVAEDEIMCGHDGLSDLGVDYFPIRKPSGGYYYVNNGAGTGGPSCSTLALLAPGPDGPVVTERFEMFREGIEMAEAILFIQRAIEEKKIAGDLEARANRYLDERGEAFIKGWYGVRCMQAEHDEKLLTLAGEVARALGGK